MIVLTDGRPNPVGPQDVLREAALAKDAGATLFTIGLGSDVDHELLRVAASAPELYFESPTASDLESIYASLLARIPCDPQQYWARR